jgi:hypothetical protein
MKRSGLQPSAALEHRELYMPLIKYFDYQRMSCACTIAFVLGSVPASALGQAPANVPAQQDAPSSLKSSDILNPALGQVSQAVAGLNISRWKAPGEVRSAAQQNADSILRDLHNTLPGLLTQADASPDSISAVFPVYRNIDALYDVLLRVSETADLAASQDEASNVGSALNQLESARKNLGDAIFSSAKNHEAEIVKLRATVAQNAAAAQPSAPAKTTVVNDGPAKTTSTKRKKKPAPAAPAQTTPPSQQQPQ